MLTGEKDAMLTCNLAEHVQTGRHELEGLLATPVDTGSPVVFTPVDSCFTPHSVPCWLYRRFCP